MTVLVLHGEVAITCHLTRASGLEPLSNYNASGAAQLDKACLTNVIP